MEGVGAAGNAVAILIEEGTAGRGIEMVIEPVDTTRLVMIIKEGGGVGPRMKEPVRVEGMTEGKGPTAPEGID